MKNIPMKKSATNLTNDQYVILKKKFIAATLRQIEIVVDNPLENEPPEKMNDYFNDYLKEFITEENQIIFKAMMKKALKVDISFSKNMMEK